MDQLEVDEVRSVEKNRMLAAEYEGLMEEHIGIKESSLQILEHQLELEAALKDLGQVSTCAWFLTCKRILISIRVYTVKKNDKCIFNGG